MIPLDTIIQGDCLEVMRGWPDGCVDLVLTDPPYGVGLDYASYDDTESNWYDLMLRFIPEARRVARMVIMPSCRIKALPFIYQHMPPDWLIAWYKGSPGHCAYVGFNDWEPLLVYGKNPGVQMHDHFQCMPEPFTNGHPCPKPVGWATWLLTRACPPGGVVLDPFAGSGTTCVAAKREGFHFVGIELDPDYCEIARARVANTPANLFAGM